MQTLKATKREERGSRKARRLREGGRTPAVIYGHGEETVSISLERHDIEQAIHHSERLLEVDLDGAVQNVLLKDVQYDSMGQEILHVDLARVNLDERVEVTVPIVLRGTPAGAAEGGVLHQINSSVTIECLVRAIPEDIRVTVNDLKVGDVLHMRDLTLPEGAVLRKDPETIVCTVSIVAEEVIAAPEAAGAAEPEILMERKEAEEGEAVEEGKEKPKAREKEKEKEADEGKK